MTGWNKLSKLIISPKGSTEQVFLQEIPLFSWLFRWNSCRTCSGSPETKGLLTYWLFIEVWSNSLEKFDRQEFPSGSEILWLIVRMSYLLLPHFLTCKMGSRHYFTCVFSEIHPMPRVRTSGTTSWKESPTEVQKIHWTFSILFSHVLHSLWAINR